MKQYLAIDIGGTAVNWNRIAEKLRREEITQDEYDEWRYHYPKLETERFRNEVLAFRKNESNN